MVVRRIREEAVKYNWFGVAVELAIVIVGVFLGLQANNWNVARTESTFSSSVSQVAISPAVSRFNSTRTSTSIGRFHIIEQNSSVPATHENPRNAAAHT